MYFFLLAIDAAYAYYRAVRGLVVPFRRLSCCPTLYHSCA